MDPGLVRPPARAQIQAVAPPSLALARAGARLLLPRWLQERAARLQLKDAGYGYDPLGMHRDWLALGVGMYLWLYRRYFRVTSHGVENIPRQGAAILAANHSGMLPVDGVMVSIDVFLHTDPPRPVRPVGDLFIPLLPLFGTLMARTGVVAGTRGNFRYLLEHEELLLVFPEGTPGIGKPFAQRYQLQDWRVGHAELAIRFRVPVIPVAVVGAEESWPQLGRLERIHAFGAPYLPVPATPFPLPSHMHIYYGKPLWLHEGLSPGDADDPEIARRAAARVKGAVEALIDHGLREREGVFR